MKPGLGTQLHILLDLLDGAVQQAYIDQGLAFRPRYTPILRVLLEDGPSTIGEIARRSGISQPAATQTVGLMLKESLVATTPGKEDARQRLVTLAPAGEALVPKLQTLWRAVDRAAASLESDLSTPLQAAVAEAIEALHADPFGDRIARACKNNKGKK